MATAVHVVEKGAAATAALHPLRLEILSELAEPESAAGLARRIGMPRQQVNYHIRQLEEQGLVKLVGERRVRNCIERLVQAVGRSYVISPAEKRVATEDAPVKGLSPNVLSFFQRAMRNRRP